MKYLRLFDNEQNYSNDIEDNVRIDVPNVSLVLNSESVFFNADTVREAYFNVTDESDMTLINDYRTFSEIYLNGGTKNLLPKLVEGSFTIDANDLVQLDEITWYNNSPKNFNATYVNSFVVSCNEEILDDYYVGFSMFAGGNSGGILRHDISLFGTLNELFGTPTNKKNYRVNSNTIDLTFFFTGLTNFVSYLNAVIFKPNENGELIPLTTKNSYVANLIEEKTYDISKTQFLDDFFLIDFTLKCEQDILPTDILFKYENNEIVPWYTIEEFLTEYKDDLCVDLIDSKTIGTTRGYYPMLNYFTLFGIMRDGVILTQEVNIVGINGFELGDYRLSTDKLGENKIEFKIINRFKTPFFYQSNNLTRLNDKALKYNKFITSEAFANCTNLTSVNIPDSVTTIGDSAFHGCSSLTSVNIPNSVTTIGEGAFYSCSSLTSVNIPNSVTTIGGYAFSGCGSLTSVTIPDSVTTIGNSAFWNCANMISVNIPNRVTTIDFGTFGECINLTGITIPDSVTSIDSHAFYKCCKLDKFIIPKNVKNIGDSAFFECKFQRDKFINHSDLTDDGNWGARLYDTIQSDGLCIDENIAKSCHQWATNVVIPSYVTNIYNSAFMGCLNLKTVSIPNSVVSIGSKAFDSCTNIIEINIPDGVTTIENSTFSRCTNLTNVNIPNSVTTIGKDAFWNCKNLTSVNIPNSVTKIGDYAFSNCNKLTSVNIPDSVTTIGGYAFSGCGNLASITIGNGVTTIGENLLTDCEELEYITVADLNPKYDSRNNCNGLIETATNTLIAGCKNTVIPSGVTKIGKYAFLDTTINTCVIPEGVTHIGKGAFEECGSLESITMPTTLTRIETDCFYDCGLKTITCLAKTAPSLGTDSLDVDTRKGVLRVPTGSDYSAWLNALPSGWTIEYI